MFDLDRADAVRAAQDYLSLPRPLFTRSPISYRVVPLAMRMRLLSLCSRRRWQGDAGRSWPMQHVLDSAIVRPSYQGRRSALIITHDVDSADELDQLQQIVDLERRYGLRSAFGFVPHVSWPSEHQARALVDQGWEVYWHDMAHDGRLAFMGRDRIRAAFDDVAYRFPWALTIMRAFRSGQLLMTSDLLEVLAERFDIDMSIPDTEQDGPYASPAGCSTVFPFRIRGLLELPLTMPQDVFLRQVYRLPADDVFHLWLRKLAYVKDAGGVAVLNVHPVWVGPRDPQLAYVYERLLDVVANDIDLLVTVPGSLARLLLDGAVSSASSPAYEGVGTRSRPAGMEVPDSVPAS